MPTEHISFPAKFAFGSIVKVVGPPVTVAWCAPLVRQVIRNQPAAASTGSLKVTVTLLSTGTPEAPATGVIAVIVGGLSPVQKCKADSRLRGFGSPVWKSNELEFVSVQPAKRRRAAVVFCSDAVGAMPSKQLAVVP